MHCICIALPAQFHNRSTGTGIHRYNFLVFDEGTKPKDYSTVAPMDLIDIDRRVYWNLTEKGRLGSLFFVLADEAAFAALLLHYCLDRVWIGCDDRKTTNYCV